MRDVFREINRYLAEVETTIRLVRAIADRIGVAVGDIARSLTRPGYEVHDLGDRIRVLAELPGVDRRDLSVTLSGDGRALLVRGRREDREIAYDIELPARVNPATARARYRNGLLVVELEKAREGYEIKIEEG
jgi:HSP20 family molecular chaperone IbpA